MYRRNIPFSLNNLHRTLTLVMVLRGNSLVYGTGTGGSLIIDFETIGRNSTCGL